MNIFLAIVLVVIAFVIVIKGADFFVAGAASIARRIGVTPFVVGLTVVAVGTSAPELVVNVIAALRDAAELSIGNVIGSNIANILLGLGVAAVIMPLTIQRQTVWKEIPFSLLSAVIIFVVGADVLLSSQHDDLITRNDGVILLCFFLIFVVYTFGLSKIKNGDDATEDITVYSIARSLFYTIGGLAALLIGGRMVVHYAVFIASTLGMSQNLIGLTVVAVGTSLPEIVTAVIAVRKGHTDLIVGGIIGSIIFNAFLILGVTATVRELPFIDANITDALFLIAISAVLFVIMFVGRRHTLERWQGIFFVLLYIGYITFAIVRG